MNSENNLTTTTDSKNELSNGELFTVFGIILSITFSTSLLTYKSINQYIKWKSLDSDRKYQYEIKLKQLEYESQIKLKQLENEGKQLDNNETQVKLKQLDNEGKQLDNEGKQLDNDGKRLDNEGKQLDNDGKRLDNEFKIKFNQT
jgi:hypothetical protein